MSITVFIAVQGHDRLVEVDLPDDAAIDIIHSAVTDAGIVLEENLVLFHDEDEHPVDWKGPKLPGHIKHGAKLHLVRCREVTVTIHYLDQTANHRFAPGARVRRIKAWAVKHFKLAERDAAEHVLQLCNSTERPSTDTPLHKLTKRGHCELCFDLVPDIRVEG